MTMGIWMLISVAIGGLLGFLTGRIQGGADARKRKEYEERLQRNESEMDDYRRQVTDHFMDTARLMQEMTANYKAVYEHLARGAQSLTNGEAQMIMDKSAERLVRQPESGEEFAPEDVAPEEALEKKNSADEAGEKKAQASPRPDHRYVDESSRLDAARQAGL